MALDQSKDESERFYLGLCLGFDALGAQPAAPPVATAPAEPVKPNITRAAAERAATAKAEEQAKAAALDKLEQSAAYKALVEDMRTKEEQLNTARKSGTSQEKIEASSAYLKVKQKVDDARAAAVQLVH